MTLPRYLWKKSNATEKSFHTTHFHQLAIDVSRDQIPFVFNSFSSLLTVGDKASELFLSSSRPSSRRWYWKLFTIDCCRRFFRLPIVGICRWCLQKDGLWYVAIIGNNSAIASTWLIDESIVDTDVLYDIVKLDRIIIQSRRYFQSTTRESFQVSTTLKRSVVECGAYQRKWATWRWIEEGFTNKLLTRKASID